MTRFSRQNPVQIGIAGIGAIGSTVAKALQGGITGYRLAAISDPSPAVDLRLPNLDFAQLAERCDLIVECLPPGLVPDLAREVLSRNKDLIVISSAALLLHPAIMDQLRQSEGRIIVPSGALCGIDGVHAMAQMGIKSARIASTKPPRGFTGTPFITENSIDLSSITEKTKLFSGNAHEAAKAFPANVNVAATLSLAGIGAERTMVEVWADPEARVNSHEITVESEYTKLSARVENLPDPRNPKTSALAAQSIIAVLKNMSEAFVIL